MSPLAWLAVPAIATLLAVVVVPALRRRRERELPAAVRAERIRRALAPDAKTGGSS